MPRYLYECEDCGDSFEVNHSMTKEWTNCILCEGIKIIRIPCMPITFSSKNEKNRKTGELVEDFIQESKESLKQEKKEIKREEYKE
tara:strand:- start:533 stop:790 length:258 start_codon:yes stop_codon:yes gene_type:complete